MRINPTPSTLVSTSVPTITSRVDPDGARRIMEMLVNLYSDQRLAVAREYVSNAVDATRAAGSTSPVAVTTPTHDEPNLIVTDRGTGMSMTEVEAAFLAFAASTKRNTNDMVGGLGVGAKSAWTLTEAFLIDTVKDGRQTTIRAARNLEHQVLLADAPSHECNGTTLIIPIPMGGDNERQWHNAVQEVARAHDAGAVIVNGAPVESIASGPRIGAVLCCQPKPDWKDRVVIRSGGTLFSAVDEVINAVRQETGLSACVVELPIGSFDHTPSRESVIATERTMTAVKTALKQYKRDYNVLAQQIVALASTDIAAAVKLRADSLGKVGNTSLLPIPYQISVPIGTGWLHCGGGNGTHRLSWKGDQSDRFNAIDTFTQLQRTIVVTNVPPKKVLSQFATFLRNQHPQARRVIAIPQNQAALALNVLHDKMSTSQTLPISAKTSGIAAHYTFEQWNAAIAAGRSTRGPLQKGYTCVVIGASTYKDTLTGPEIAALGLPVIYVEESYEGWRHPRSTAPSITVYLDKRKSGPLIAAIPGAMTPNEWTQRQLDNVTASLSPSELLAVYYNSARRCDTYRVAFDIAHGASVQTALVAVSNGYHQHAKHPIHALLLRIATLVHDARKATIKLDNHVALSMSAQHNVIDKLYADLTEAYPLLNLLAQHHGEQQHYVNYVVHTPPVGGSNAHTN